MTTANDPGPHPGFARGCACRRIAVSPTGSAPTGPAVERRPAQRTRSAAAFALPSIALALVPKCPMCIAAYLAIGGGFGVSLTTAAHLRTALLWTCWSVLAFLVARLAVRRTSRARILSIARQLL